MVIPPKKQNKRQLGQICPCEICEHLEKIRIEKIKHIKSWLDTKINKK